MNKTKTKACETEHDNPCFFNESEETIEIWVQKLLEANKKDCISYLSVEEIQEEIEEVKGTIKNEKVWASDDKDDMHRGNIRTLEAYLVVLNEAKVRTLKNEISNLVYRIFHCRGLSTDQHKPSIDAITLVCCNEIDEHPELAEEITDDDSRRYFVEQMILESWLLHKELLEKLTSNALYPPEGVEKGKKLYEAYHEGIIEHEIKDIFICIETDKANVMASGVGENFFADISGAINAIEKANAKINKELEQQKMED